MNDPARGGHPAVDPLTRRALLAGSAAAGAGIAIGYGAAHASEGNPSPRSQSAQRVPFYGSYQAGIATPQPDYLLFAAFDIASKSLSDLQALLVSWSRAAASLTSGEPLTPRASSSDQSPIDTGEATGIGPAALTLTIGLGPSLFDPRRHPGLARLQPPPLLELPPFPGESLDQARSGGDLCIQACSSNAQIAFHAIHNLARIASSTATLRWTQTGFNRTSNTIRAQATPRNLLGFKDGTNNIRAEDQAAMQRHVWAGPKDTPSWMRNGTYLVTRRIRILFDVWDANTLAEQERTIGRHKLTGAPLGHAHENDPVPLAAETNGEPLIPSDAHIRLAAPRTNDGQRILRRGYSFADPIEPGSGQLNAGLFFICFQRDPRKQFIPIQRRLAERDALSKSLIHTASSVFAIPPGARHQGFVGETLFKSLSA